MEIRLLREGDVEAVVAASALFDGPADPEASQRFLDAPDHFLFVAYDAQAPVGFVSGVETTHPDKGTEMFLYELSVAEPFRQRGIGTALVDALRTLAQERGCYGMWVLTDDDNAAARATYTAAGAAPPTSHVMLTWDFEMDGKA
jgi:ribosomal protein S18 acetylase RimI-like enzyme